MMKKIITTLMLSLVSTAIYAQDSDAALRLVQQSMTKLMQKNNINGAAVELYANGKLYEQYYGYADEAKKEPVIRKTIFEIGSLSKLMTSILLAQEVDWAKMSFTDPVTKYLKGLPPAFDKIRLQDLAMHTSGLPLSLPKNVNTQDELKNYLNHWSPAVKPGSEWLYSSVGVGVLGIALEASTESEYGDLYRRHILNPLKMVNGVMVPPALTKYYAQGYDASGHPVARVDASLIPGAGAIKASASDMQHFLSAAICLPGTPPRVSYPIRMTQSMYIKTKDGMQGLGWQIHAIKSRYDINNLLNVADKQELGPSPVVEVYERPVYSGDVLVDKTGSTKGFKAYIAVIPNKNSGIVILVNKNISNNDVVKTAREILLKVTNLM
jgi:beta-lactamase class C